jgi:hypothetical protein
MATQIVMDHTGDTRHYFDADDTEALLKAEERFQALTSRCQVNPQPNLRSSAFGFWRWIPHTRGIKRTAPTG